MLIAVRRVDDLPGKLVKRNVEIRAADCLGELAEQVRQSALNGSLYKMANAQPRGPA